VRSAYRLLLTAVVLVWALALSGCMKDLVVIHVEPDGSGQIHETLELNTELTDLAVEGVAGALGGQPGEKTETPAINWQESARQRASQYGPGVVFMDATEDKQEGWWIGKAVYSFSDVTKLNPPQPQQQAEAAPPGDMNFNIGTEHVLLLGNFDLRRLDDATSELTIRMPPPKEEKPTEKPEEQAQEGAPGPEEPPLEFFKQIFKGMEMGVAVECGQEVLASNATYREGNHVTLLHLSFDEIMALLGDPAKLKQLEQLMPEPKNLQEAQEALRHIEGVKIEIQPEVTVKFR